MYWSKKVKNVGLVLITIFSIQSVLAQIGAWDPEMEKNCQKTIEAFKDKNQKFDSYFTKAYGYAILPNVGKGAIGIGGAHGKGLVYEQGQIVGETKMTQITIGFQWGGQAYSEVLFFEDEKAMKAFKYGGIEFAGQASAVAVTAGASADIAYKNGIAVFTLAKGGLMYEASIGGQKFKYFPAPDNQ
jgi:lipid-binding SYLF domain-containing protein